MIACYYLIPSRMSSTKKSKQWSVSEVQCRCTIARNTSCCGRQHSDFSKKEKRNFHVIKQPQLEGFPVDTSTHVISALFHRSHNVKTLRMPASYGWTQENVA